REVILRPPHAKRVADAELLMDLFGATAAPKFFEYRDTILLSVRRIAAETVLPDQTGAQHDIKVGTRLPFCEISAVGAFEDHRHDPVGLQTLLPNNQIHQRLAPAVASRAPALANSSEITRLRILP